MFFLSTSYCSFLPTGLSSFSLQTWGVAVFQIRDGSQVNDLTKKASQGAKKIIFKACHSGKLKPAFTSPDVISTSLKNFLTSRIDFRVLDVTRIPQKASLARRAS